MFFSWICCEGSGLWEELIARSEESYRVCVIQQPRHWGVPGPSWAVGPIKIYGCMYVYFDNIKVDLQEVGCWDVDWIELAQDRDRWWLLVNAVMKHRVP